MRLTALLPVYNEEATLLDLVQRLAAVAVVAEIVAVDDGSNDRSPEILESLAQDLGRKLRVATHKRNLGKGAALRTALVVANGTHVIVQDGDLEYCPEEIALLAEHASRHPDQAVYGSRFLELRRSQFPMTGHFLGNWLLTRLCNWASRGRLRLTDMATCYKLIPRNILELCELEQDGFGFDPEVTLKIAQLGVTISELAVSYHGRGKDEGKKLRLRDGFLYLNCLWRYRVRSEMLPGGSAAADESSRMPDQAR